MGHRTLMSPWSVLEPYSPGFWNKLSVGIRDRLFQVSPHDNDRLAYSWKVGCFYFTTLTWQVNVAPLNLDAKGFLHNMSGHRHRGMDSATCSPYGPCGRYANLEWTRNLQ
jgi:hypothetical protein